MPTGVTCTVFIDGQRAADGSLGEADDAPKILEDLAVTWGRSDTMSQPAPDSCTFSVLDEQGGTAFAELYRTGRRVDVLAHGDAFPDPSVPTFLNGDFETDTPQSWHVATGAAARSSVRALSGSYSLALTDNGNVYLAPDAFQSSGTNPDAWDDIPTTMPGQTWTLSVSVWAPVGAVVRVRPVLYSGPYVSAATVVGAIRTINGNGAWQTLTFNEETNVAFSWVGIHVDAEPSGPTWNAVPIAQTWETTAVDVTWNDYGTAYVDAAQVTSPAAGTSRGVLVFSGRITDVSASWDESAGCVVADVSCAGFTADLDNRNVGDEPWNVESVAARAQRIVTLSEAPITLDIAETVAATLVSWRDVDAQGATNLLQELAVSVDGVLWPAVHLTLGAYLLLEDPALRASILQLELVDNVVVIVQGNADAIDISACLIGRDAVEWLQDVSDVVTRVSVTWKQQGIGDEGEPTTTDVTETIIDNALEAEYGTRGASVSTQLQAEADALDVAERIALRASPRGWRASGLTIDDALMQGNAADISLLLDLLDGTSRIGAALLLTDMPSWSPSGESVGVYLEGGTYRYVGGHWFLELGVSQSGGGLGASATWAQIDPLWTWTQFDPSISWNDVRGVAA